MSNPETTLDNQLTAHGHVKLKNGHLWRLYRHPYPNKKSVAYFEQIKYDAYDRVYTYGHGYASREDVLKEIERVGVVK